MRTAALRLLLAVPCALGAQSPQPEASLLGGTWYLVNGDRARAKAVFERVLAGKAWTAFGFIAAEADVTRGF
jgi:hypothetical protein